MASFTERIRLLFDVESKGTKNVFGDFARSFREAEGFTGKFKAGFASLKDSFSSFASSGAGMATVATTAGAALWKAADAAQDLALEIGKLSDATGLSAEQASRWIEVGKDMGMSSETTAGLIEKLTKNIGTSPQAFEQMGISVQYAKDGTVDMNATLVQALDVLHGIKDPTERAAAGAKLFGKSWSDASELISAGGKSIKERLAEVHNAKVFDERQIKQARDFRDAMDKLKDVGEEITLTIGKAVIPAFSDLANIIGFVTDVFPNFEGGLQASETGLFRLSNAIDQVRDSWRMLTGYGDIKVEFTGETVTNFQELGVSAADAANNIGELASKTLGELPANIRTAAVQAGNLADRLDDARLAFDDLRDDLADQKSLVDLRIHLRDNAAKLAELNQKYKDGKITAQEWWDQSLSTALDSKIAVAGYVKELGNVPADLETKIVTSLDPAAPETMFDTLQGLFNRRTFHVEVGAGTVGDPRLSGGGGGGGLTVTGPVTINAPDMSPEAVARALAKWERRNGAWTVRRQGI